MVATAESKTLESRYRQTERGSSTEQGPSEAGLRDDRLPEHREAIAARLRGNPPTSDSTSNIPTTSSPERNRAYEAMVRACSDPAWVENHGGSAYSVLRGREDLFDAPFREVHAIPQPEYVASNFKPGSESMELYYVNGMRATPDDIQQHLTKLVKVCGRPVTAIINDQEREIPLTAKPGFFRSAFNALCGLLSADAGHAVESGAVGRIEEVIKRHLASGQKLHLLAHSQGSIIVRNALDRVLGEGSQLSAEQKEKVKALVSVSTFGAAEHYFPVGIQVQEYAHRNDPIAIGTSIFTDMREGIKSVYGFAKTLYTAIVPGAHDTAAKAELALQRAPRVYLEGDHAFGPFISKLPEFFIKKYSVSGSSPGASVAAALTESIRAGYLSDVGHAVIIQRMLQGDNRVEFAREFLRLNPTGEIGAFKIPVMDTLRSISGRESSSEVRRAGNTFRAAENSPSLAA